MSDTEIKDKDKYDEAIEYLTEHPEEIGRAWSSSETHPQGCLFQHLSPNGHLRYGGEDWGCPTQIRSIGMRAYTDELTAAVLRDNRIPQTNNIAPRNLRFFARIQRLADSVLGRS